MKNPSRSLRVAAVQAPRGFSLLEVILSLAILGGTVAVLGEAIRLGAQNASYARDMTHAQLLCESILAEIAAGIIPLDNVRDEPVDVVVGNGAITWLYSIGWETVEEDGLLNVSVTVVQDLPNDPHPVSFTLSRWMPDVIVTSGMDSSLGPAAETAESLISDDVWSNFEMQDAYE
jgi:general secretion pathway protein I